MNCFVRMCLLCVASVALAQADEVKPPQQQPVPDTAASSALKWLAAQQGEDGGWAFADPRRGGKRAGSSNEATGLALLAFLSAGQTHKDGAYKKQVHAGLAFLIKRMEVKKQTGDLRGRQGDMISHAIAARALCDAYAMTHDKELLAPAQLSINFIVAQQDKQTGGWTEDPMSKPNMLSTGWQLMALKNAHLAYLNVPKGAILGAMKFLDNAQLDEGRAFAGPDGQREHRATAVGLYCRWMLGWKRDNPKLVAGLAAVGRGGPQKHDVVANYFAHQLHHECLGESWPPWNEAIRKQLIDSQIREGDQAGSWRDAQDRSAARGGPLLQTAISVMILNIFVRGRDFLRVPEGDDEFAL